MKLVDYSGDKTKLGRDLEALRAQMQSDQSSYREHWREISDFIRPRRPRFLVTDVNNGAPRTQKILNSRATLASRTMAAGMMSGITSPARSWFNLQASEHDINKIPAVKEWLYETTQRMRVAFLRSNFYKTVQSFYQDLGDFGISALLVEEDLARVAHFDCFPIGSYWVANDENGKVNRLYREFSYTAGQVLDRFGELDQNGVRVPKDDFSNGLKNSLKNNSTQDQYIIGHAILPNPNFRKGALGPNGKKFLSCYWERGATNGTSGPASGGAGGSGTFLEIAGYGSFPILVARWQTSGENPYPETCPGMEALPDVKQIQAMERRGAQGLEKMVTPSLQGPSTLVGKTVNLLPGGMTIVDTTGGRDGVRPVHEVRIPLDQLEAKIESIGRRIDETYFKHLFLMMIETDRREITAREVDERAQEKMLALGPVLEQMNQDVFDPLIGMILEFEFKQGRLSAPPKELQGRDVQVEYLSIMAQAQKALGLASVDRFAAFAFNTAQVNPEVIDTVDTDRMVETYGELITLPPGIIRAKDEVSVTRAQRSAQMAAQKQAEMAAQGSQTAKNLSQAVPAPGGNDALSMLINQAQAGAPA